MELRQSTSQIIRFGPFLDATDGVTPETALTITQADMQLSKDGAAFAQKNAAGNATHDVDGYYTTTFDATDSNTTAILKLQINVSGALPVFDNYDVVTQSYYDAKYSGTFNNFDFSSNEVTINATSVDLIWDEPLTGAAHNVSTSSGRRLRGLQDFGNYLGQIHIDTVNGEAGTVIDENGTVENYVLTLADALTLNSTLGYNSYNVRNGSTITLSASVTNALYAGVGWVLALNSQVLTDSRFEGADVSGIATGSGDIEFISCEIGNITLPPCHINGSSGLGGTITAGAAGDYFINNCYSQISGTSTPSFDYAAVGNVNVGFRRYSGGIEIKNMNAGDTMSLEGDGQLIINVNCTGGIVAIRGNFTITDNAGAAVTISDDARFDVTQIENSVWDATLTGSNHNNTTSAGRRLRTLASVVIRNKTAQGAGTGNNQIQLDTGASAIDGAYDPSIIAIIAGTGAGQARLILQYEGATKTATVDRNWKMNPDATSEFNIIADAGRNHVNEGLVQSSTANTITLNALASSGDDVYVGQIVFIRSGTGEDQSGTVIDYNGTTKVATIDKNWVIVPDTTSAYTMIPSSPVILANTNHTGAVIPNVTLVGTTTTNTDMRGTELALLSSNYTAPDNAGITQTQVDIAAVKVDTTSTKTKTDNMVFTVTNQIDSNIKSIDDNSTSASNLSKSTIAIESGIAATGTLSTTEMTTNLTEETDDHYIGRVIIWTSGVLKNQATDITDYTGASKKLTYTATTEAPSNNDTFVIL